MHLSATSALDPWYFAPLLSSVLDRREELGLPSSSPSTSETEPTQADAPRLRDRFWAAVFRSETPVTFPRLIDTE